MKRFCIIFLIFLIFLVSCAPLDNSPELSSTIPSPTLELSPPDEGLYSITIYSKDSQNLNNESWLSFLRDDYGIEILPHSQKMNDGIESVNIAYENSPALVHLFYSELVGSYPEIKDKIIPLGNFLENNEIWDTLPENYKLNGVYEGSLLGIPLQYNEYGSSENVRLYHSTILDALNITVPEDTNSFYEYLLGVSQNVMSDYLMNTTKTSPFYDMGDIFMSFGVKSDYHTETLYSFGYNHTDKKYYDSAGSPEMAQVLEYIVNLSLNGFINIADTKSFPTESFYQESTATVINSLSQISLNRSINIEYSLGFKNPSNMLLYVQQSKGLYVLVNTSADSDLNLDYIISKLLKNDKTNKAAYLGSTGNYNEYGDNLIIFKGSIVNDAPYLFGNILIPQKVISRNKPRSNANAFSETELRSYSTLLQLYKEKAEIWNFVPFTIEDLSLRIESEYATIFQTYAQSLYSHNVAVEEMIENYLLTMKVNGGNDYLEKLNSHISN